MPIIPHLYLDTNVILDAIHKRWPASVNLMDKIKNEKWDCSTSSFTILELLDTEHEETFVQNLLDKGVLLSKVRTILGTRYQAEKGLTSRELIQIWTDLHDLLNKEYSFINFTHPEDYKIWDKIWDKAIEICGNTNIAATDAIHLSIAILWGCNILVTKDQDFRAVADNHIIAILPEQIDTAILKLKRKS